MTSYRLEAEWTEAEGSRLFARPVFVTPEGDRVADVVVELEGSLLLDPQDFFPGGVED